MNAVAVLEHEQIGIEQAMEALSDFMYRAVNSDVEVLRDASRHILQAGGKRLRPRMLLSAYLACGGTDLTRVLPVAAAVELVHTASVVHDDINDHGVLRRGRPSVNAVWGRTFALLTGDFLFTKVYELMAPHQDLNIYMSEATTALVEGETLQAAAVKNNTLTRAVYYDIIGRKTAALFKAAAGMGARLADASAATINTLEQYGYTVGLAFQIVDDILDIIGDEAKLGKTAQLDIAQGKGFSAVQEDDPMARFKQKLMEGDTLEQARASAHQLVDSAKQMLLTLPNHNTQDLHEMADYIIAREF
jgi:octaprenyl-diphosphate synthase